MQGPCNRHHTCAHAVRLAYFREKIRHCQISREQRFLVVLGIAAKIITRKLGNALFGHSPGQEAGMHGGVVDNANVVLLAEGRMAASTARFNMEYGGWFEVMGAIFITRSICSGLKFETPIQRALPSFCSAAITPHASSISSSGLGQCIW